MSSYVLRITHYLTSIRQDPFCFLHHNQDKDDVQCMYSHLTLPRWIRKEPLTCAEKEEHDEVIATILGHD